LGPKSAIAASFEAVIGCPKEHIGGRSIASQCRSPVLSKN
jgi:hypothetical protein